MYDKVFISYAREDRDTAEKLFDFLTLYRYEPWLDKKKLLPGQDWNTEIRLALKKADFIVLLLSKTSIAKRGFVQREFKLALEYCEEKLDSDIYIIPCKIDDCEVPDKLSKFQWAELNTPESFEQILSSLNLQRKKYEELERLKISANTTFEFNEITIKKVIGDKPKNNIDIVYPKFVDVNNEDLRLLNTYIEYLAFKSYNGFILPFGNGLFEDSTSDDYEFPDNELQLSYKIELLTKDFISYTIFTYSYTGGAHGLYGTSGYNYRLNPLFEFNLETFFDHKTEILKSLQIICKEKLLKKAKEEFEIEREEDFFLFRNPLEPKWETFNNFYLKQDSIVIIFSIYQLTAYVYGQHEVEITFDEIISKHKDLKTIKKVKKLLET
ncbi:MAG TPA: TIR domain-containing protein [Chitinophagaceae bacterium]|nr:TIR domain-containing protein [Chitinophagaceae bacterium]